MDKKEKDQIRTWIEIGNKNYWIPEAWDPPFNEESFYFCQSVEELKEKFIHGNWCLGQAFVLGNLCFIQQVNAGDEWYTIKENVAFESISFGYMLENYPEEYFYDYIKALQKATLEECKNLDYGKYQTISRNYF